MLHPTTGQKGDVLAALNNAVDAFSNNNAAVQQKMAQRYTDPALRERIRHELLASLQTAHQQAADSETDPKWFTPRGPMAGLAQAAMNFRFNLQVPKASPAFAQAPFEQFGPLDPGWIECLIDGFVVALKGKAKFVEHTSLNNFLHTIPDKLTVALVSDWGASNDAAALVSKQIKAANPDIVIHLGDIYYAGQRNEVDEMLKLWPLTDSKGHPVSGRSFALNGNHEMFSGGHSYFDRVLPAFGQQASYFGLRNSHWQILAFDSAYIEQRLLPPAEAQHVDARLISQWNWLLDKLKNSKLPTILLCHHQPVSAYKKENDDSAKLRNDFQQLSAAAGKPVFAWFFGHEHKSTIYDDPNIPYFARLIGNGCIPHFAPSANQEPESGCYSFSRMNTGTNSKGDAFSGFALLKFNGASIDLRYINENGSLFYEEIWDAPPTN